MRVRKSVVASFAALICGAYVVATAPAPASAQTGPEFGFASLTTLVSKSSTEYNTCAAQVKSVGASWVRLVVPWNNIEPNQGAFNFSTIDPAVLAAQANGTKILLLLTGPAPLWAQGLLGNPFSGAATPTDPATFGRFAGATATRYKNYASTFEIWNEPNDPGFYASPNVSTYIQLLKAAYQSIHAVQPTAVVITGGVTSNPGASITETAFVEQLYSNGARPYLDGIGMHPYTIPYGISDDPGHHWNDLATARGSMTRYGDAAKKIWVTEWGLPTGTSTTYASTEAKQGSSLVEALQTVAATPYLGPLFIFTERDYGSDTSNPNMNFGVFRYDGTPKASAYAIKQYATSGAPATTPSTTTTTTTTTTPTTTTTTRPPTTTTTTTRPPTTTPPATTTPAPNVLSAVGKMLGLW